MPSKLVVLPPPPRELLHDLPRHNFCKKRAAPTAPTGLAGLPDPEEEIDATDTHEEMDADGVEPPPFVPGSPSGDDLARRAGRRLPPSFSSRLSDRDLFGAGSTFPADGAPPLRPPPLRTLLDMLPATLRLPAPTSSDELTLPSSLNALLIPLFMLPISRERCDDNFCGCFFWEHNLAVPATAGRTVFGLFPVVETMPPQLVFRNWFFTQAASGES